MTKQTKNLIHKLKNVQHTHKDFKVKKDNLKIKLTD